MLTGQCPDAGEIARYIDKRTSSIQTSSTASPEFIGHLNGCESCRLLVDVLVEKHSTRTDLPPGKNIGPYIVLQSVGRGGMGVVYAAYDPRLDRKVALKLLRSKGEATDRAAGERLRREARALARVSHPNVVAAHDVQERGNEIALAMEYVDGKPLHRWLAEEPRGWQSVADIFIAAGRGLVAAHAAGVVHRDFKPHNVLVGVDGRVRVTDFGLAAPLDTAIAGDSEINPPEGETDSESCLTHRGQILGTPAYMAPEQWQGRPADASADQFAFCVAFYEALSGQRPFAALSPEAMCSAAASTAPPPLRCRGLPRGIRAAIEKGLAWAPSDRHPSMELLLGVINHERTRPLRRILGGGLLAVGLLALVLGGLWAATEGTALCRGAADRTGGVWGETQQQNISKAFAVSGRPSAADSLRSFRAHVVAYLAAWRQSYTETCEATHLRGEQSSELLDRRMICLNQRLEEMRALVTEFGRAGDVSPGKSVEAVQRLERVSVCTVGAGLDTRYPQRLTKIDATDLANLQAQFARAKALAAAERHDSGLTEMSAVIARAATLGHGSLQARALYAQAGIYRVLERGPEARAAAIEAAKVAATEGDNALMAKSWIHYLFVLILVENDITKAKALLPFVDAARLSVAADMTIQAKYSNLLGLLASRQSDPQSAIIHFRDSARLTAQTEGAESIAAARMLNNVGIS